MSGAAAQPQEGAPRTGEPLLELKNASVNYGGIQALRDVDLVVCPGEVVTLIGANGAGKSTTLRAISRLVALHSGDLVYAGKSLLRERPEALGLAVAGMPVGSPGMDGAVYGGRKDPYDVLLLARDGSATVYRAYR